MDSYFEEALAGLRDAAQHMMAANAQMIAANTEIQAGGAALIRATAAAMHAKNEHGDMRETLDQLKQLVMEQGDELRLMREERKRRENGGSDGRGN